MDATSIDNFKDLVLVGIYLDDKGELVEKNYKLHEFQKLFLSPAQTINPPVDAPMNTTQDQWFYNDGQKKTNVKIRLYESNNNVNVELARNIIRGNDKTKSKIWENNNFGLSKITKYYDDDFKRNEEDYMMHNNKDKDQKPILDIRYIRSKGDYPPNVVPQNIKDFFKVAVTSQTGIMRQEPASKIYKDMIKTKNGPLFDPKYKGYYTGEMKPMFVVGLKDPIEKVPDFIFLVTDGYFVSSNTAKTMDIGEVFTKEGNFHVSKKIPFVDRFGWGMELTPLSGGKKSKKKTRKQKKSKKRKMNRRSIKKKTRKQKKSKKRVRKSNKKNYK